MLRRMAVSGTVPRKSRPSSNAARVIRVARRLTFAATAVIAVLFVMRFRTRWVPAGMDTTSHMPPGSWCLIDRWASGMQVGSDVFVETPEGVLLSRVRSLDATTLRVEHEDARSRLPDSRKFGPLPRSAVVGKVMVVLHEGERR